MKNGLKLKEHSASITLGLRLTDGICFILAGFLSFWLRFSNFDMNGPHTYALILGTTLGLISLSSFGAYRAWRGATVFSEIRCVFNASVTTFIILVICGFLTHSSDLFSRIWILSWLILTVFLLLAYRISLRKTIGQLRAKGYNIRKVIIIGDGELALRVARTLTNTKNSGFIVQGFIGESSTSIIKSEFQYLGNIKNLEEIVRDNKVDQAWVALPMEEAEKMKKVQASLSNSSVTIRLVPDIFGFQLLNHSLTEVAGLPVINLSTSHMIEGKNRLLKSIEDKVISSIILVLISPLLIAIAIAIKLTSPGPVLFKQYRTGNNGADFKVYKFRSMVVHKEKDGTVTQAKKQDTRVTKVGAFLRRTSLDELPQFVNVLQGRMSIVGPRPHALAHNQYYKGLVESYMRRHMVKPGITGWAQINGFRGETDTIDKMQGRVEHDLYYIENWSIWLDLKIIFLTVFKGFINRNAF
ncbi:undecaprenyl-phosphate glucose phosphotransferase [Marinomonas vulgaris]|uniref:undecaprenyl-phosphate glucose phosphotransferase n=1 Tax=Marinomonas vulgaris TaxID=2823372 RepID=UPI002E2B9A8F|nr:undecaprenyl-phosphate glucose phosphotransferase [Marinomonas vulgaris]